MSPHHLGETAAAVAAVVAAGSLQKVCTSKLPMTLIPSPTSKKHPMFGFTGDSGDLVWHLQWLSNHEGDIPDIFNPCKSKTPSYHPRHPFIWQRSSSAAGLAGETMCDLWRSARPGLTCDPSAALSDQAFTHKSVRFFQVLHLQKFSRPYLVSSRDMFVQTTHHAPKQTSAASANPQKRRAWGGP